MQSIRAAIVLFIFVTATVAGIPWQSSALRFKLPRRKTFPNRYHRWLCRLFGFRITVIGKPIQDRGVLMVANHTSYWDILILSGTARVSFVAKREVGTWPFFGTMARLQETVFVDRDRRSGVGESRDEIRKRLKEGDALVLFPEGTSSDGNCVLAFKSALMGAAESEVGLDSQGHVQHVPVQPVSVSYVGIHGIPMGRENRPLFAWYGDMDLIPHLWESVVTGPMDIVVEFHPAVTVDSAGGRKRLAQQVEETIRRGQARALAGRAATAAEPRRNAEEIGEDGLAEAAA
ncbi:MAG: 1-acyl-sn-glycerol-3-phosphate acyltransferase [Proteobacteria bacterium]|nr:1-acyl-sn-glycerol-3-phosphate acyltransferase [Pseudomonadota bacterium]